MHLCLRIVTFLLFLTIAIVTADFNSKQPTPILIAAERPRVSSTDSIVEEAKSYWKLLMRTRYLKQYVGDGGLEGMEKQWKEEGNKDIAIELMDWWQQEGSSLLASYMEENNMVCKERSCFRSKEPGAWQREDDEERWRKAVKDRFKWALRERDEF